VALKLWPIVMLPVFLLRRAARATVLRSSRDRLVLGGISLAIAGYSRLVSPVNWQAARGLQIESVSATPLMLARAVHPHGTWDIRTSKYKATEMFGPAFTAWCWSRPLPRPWACSSWPGCGCGAVGYPTCRWSPSAG